MPDIVHAQFTHTNAYLTQLIEQFTRIDQQIENGDTITINMCDGDRSMSLTVSRDKVVERATSPQRPATGQAPALAANDSLVAALTKSFSVGIGAANRKISICEIQSHISKPPAAKPPVGSRPNLPRALEVPAPSGTGQYHATGLPADWRVAAIGWVMVGDNASFKDEQERNLP